MKHLTPEDHYGPDKQKMSCHTNIHNVYNNDGLLSEPYFVVHGITVLIQSWLHVVHVTDEWIWICCKVKGLSFYVKAALDLWEFILRSKATSLSCVYKACIPGLSEGHKLLYPHPTPPPCGEYWCLNCITVATSIISVSCSCSHFTIS